MILAIDVHYRENYAKAVGVLFEWEDITHRWRERHARACKG